MCLGWFLMAFRFFPLLMYISFFLFLGFLNFLVCVSLKYSPVSWHFFQSSYTLCLGLLALSVTSFLMCSCVRSRLRMSIWISQHTVYMNNLFFPWCLSSLLTFQAFCLPVLFFNLQSDKRTTFSLLRIYTLFISPVYWWNVHTYLRITLSVAVLICGSVDKLPLFQGPAPPTRIWAENYIVWALVINSLRCWWMKSLRTNLPVVVRLILLSEES